jgi:tetratricopeptide (TPR) repeat protein
VSAAADHHRAAGNDADGARLSVRAAQLAVEVFAFDEAIAHYEAAIALGFPDRSGLLRRIGDLRTLMGQYGAALAAYEAARAMLLSLDPSPEVAEVAHAMGEVYRRLRRWDMAAAAFEEANAQQGIDDGLRSRVAADWAFVEHQRGREPRARDLVMISLSSADESGDPGVVAHANNLAGLLAKDLAVKVGHFEQALTHASEPSARAAVLNNLALTLAATGDLPGAIAHGRRALEVAVAAGDRHRTAALHDSLADYLHRSGDEERAMEELKMAVSLFAEIRLEPGTYVPEVWLLKEW